MAQIDVEHAVSFTGHRPERLDIDEEKVLEWLEEQIRTSIAEGYTDFISGMQRGVDLWAAEIVLRIREEMKDKEIRLFSAVAFSGMENRWEEDWQKRYHAILNAADGIAYVSDRPGKVAFFKRNEWMVDHSGRVIAVYTGSTGGTKATVQYAKRQGKEIIMIK